MIMEDGTPTSLSHICNTDPAMEVRNILDRIGDKWTLLVISLLEGGTMRFMELRRDIGPISQRMLTRTLRALERDGLVERTVLPVIPPHVEYSLTPLGRTLLVATRSIVDWAQQHHAAVAIARAQYDQRNGDGASGSDGEDTEPRATASAPQLPARLAGSTLGGATTSGGSARPHLRHDNR